MENVLNEAALLAARRNKTEIGMQEIEDAMVKVTMGPEKKTKVRSDHEKKLVAYHEAGHAVVSKFLPTQDPVHEISIVPRGMLEVIQCIDQQKINHLCLKQQWKNKLYHY